MEIIELKKFNNQTFSTNFLDELISRVNITENRISKFEYWSIDFTQSTQQRTQATKINSLGDQWYNNKRVNIGIFRVPQKEEKEIKTEKKNVYWRIDTNFPNWVKDIKSTHSRNRKFQIG